VTKDKLTTLLEDLLISHPRLKSPIRVLSARIVPPVGSNSSRAYGQKGDSTHKLVLYSLPLPAACGSRLALGAGIAVDAVGSCVFAPPLRQRADLPYASVEDRNGLRSVFLQSLVERKFGFRVDSILLMVLRMAALQVKTGPMSASRPLKKYYLTMVGVQKKLRATSSLTDFQLHVKSEIPESKQKDCMMSRAPLPPRCQFVCIFRGRELFLSKACRAAIDAGILRCSLVIYIVTRSFGKHMFCRRLYRRDAVTGPIQISPGFVRA
jgi:hypothetical protein